MTAGSEIASDEEADLGACRRCEALKHTAGYAPEPGPAGERPRQHRTASGRNDRVVRDHLPLIRAVREGAAADENPPVAIIAHFGPHRATIAHIAALVPAGILQSPNFSGERSHVLCLR
jgi:hypothetical protein